MRLQIQSKAPDFTGATLFNKTVRLSDYAGKRILLSFFRNGACAMCNLRVHELIKNYNTLQQSGIFVLAVFESSREDMLPYVGQQDLPFDLIADPAALIYDKYGVESSQEKITHVIQSGLAEERIKEAAAMGFPLIKQENSNFFRLPADFLIDEKSIIRKIHYSDFVIDHMDLNDVVHAFDSELKLS